MENQKKQIWLPILFSLVMVLGMFIGYYLRSSSSSVGNFLSFNKANALQEITGLIQNKYVDPVKMDSITELTINELLSHLDPHSIYIPPIDVQAVNDDLNGSFQGVGIEFQVFDDTVQVINVVKNGPSEKAGVLIGDKIIYVNDTTKVAGVKISAEKIRTYMRGEANSKVDITVLRNNLEKKITITRGNISISTVDAAYLIEPKIGFIRLNKFGEKTYEEFMENLEKLQKQGMINLILDLRGNTGGLLNEAVDIADEFLSNNKLVVYTQGNKSARYEFKSKRDGLFETGKLVVLVDETSASASEVLAGALQDWDRATIVGKRTFGKGLVQQQFPLSNGGALRLTIARYYTPLGRNIQKTYINKTKEEYRNDALGIHSSEKFENEDSSHPKPSFKTPKGRIVYGGGGILPDIIIDNDTLPLSKEVVKFYKTNLLNEAAIKLFLIHKQSLEKINSPDKMNTDFILNEQDWKFIENLATKKSITLNLITNKEKVEILEDIKAMIGKLLFGNNGFFEIANKEDKVVLKGVELLQEKK